MLIADDHVYWDMSQAQSQMIIKFTNYTFKHLSMVLNMIHLLQEF